MMLDVNIFYAPEIIFISFINFTIYRDRDRDRNALQAAKSQAARALHRAEARIWRLSGGRGPGLQSGQEEAEDLGSERSNLG